MRYGFWANVFAGIDYGTDYGIECTLIIGTGNQVQVFFSLILDSSVGLSAGIQSAGDSVPETLRSNPAFSRGRQLVSLESKIACLSQSIEINKNMHKCLYIYMCVNYRITHASVQLYNYISFEH